MRASVPPGSISGTEQHFTSAVLPDAHKKRRINTSKYFQLRRDCLICQLIGLFYNQMDTKRSSDYFSCPSSNIHSLEKRRENVSPRYVQKIIATIENCMQFLR